MKSIAESGLWETRFAELQAFRKRFGHCRVPPDWPHNKPLAKWVIVQQNRSDRLSLDQLRQLYDIGFPFGRHERQWLAGFFEFADWHRTQDDQYSRTRFSHVKRLRSWVVTQRMLNNQGKLLLWRKRLLNQLGIDWAPIQSAWETRVRHLQALKKLHGHCRWWMIKMPNDLRRWIWSIRQRRPELSKRQLQDLQELGFTWSAKKDQQEFWRQNLASLAQFKKQHGHCLVPKDWPANPDLALWVKHLRGYRQQGHPVLKPSQIRELDQLGFCWTPRAERVSQRVAELKAFQQKHGHCDVPRDWPTNVPLSRWVRKMRSRRDRQPQWLIQTLDELQFNWHPLEASWEKPFQKLVKFKRQYGHCDVHQVYLHENRDLKPLLAWINQQRANQQSLPVDRVQRLNELGFPWDYFARRWQDRYAQLKLFRQEHGHCRIPIKWPPNRALATWVSVQRAAKKAKRLTIEKIELLDKIGFEWSLRKARS